MNDPVDTVAALTETVKTMGGTSGALYRIMLTAAHGHLTQLDHVPTPVDYTDALKAGVDAISTYGGAKQGYRTMLDALIPFVNTLSQEMKTGAEPLPALERAVQTAEASAEATTQMKALAGRSNYVPDHGSVWTL